MSFDSVFRDTALAQIYAVADSATYAPSVGDPSTVSVFVDTEYSEQPGGFDSSAGEIITTISLISADVPDIARGETLTIGSTVYTVVLVEDDLPGRQYETVVTVTS